MKTVIGIDISKNFVDVAFLEPDGKCVVRHFNSNNTDTAFEILQKVDKSITELKVVMESTGTYGLQLAHAFYDLGCEIYVVNALPIRRFAQMKMSRAKTDTLDARIIAEYGQTQELRPWIPRSKEREELRQIVKALEDLQKITTTVRNRLEALSQNPIQSSSVREKLEELMHVYKTQIKELQSEADQLAEKANKETYDLLRSIPGVGPILTNTLIAQFGSFEEHEGVKSVVASVGLNPAPYMSGTSVRGRSPISKRGHGYIRRVLYMAALSAKKNNPQCAALYERMLERHPSKKRALIGVAHKLLRQAYGVVKNKTPYEPNFLENLPLET